MMNYLRTIPPFRLFGWVSVAALASAPAFAQSSGTSGSETGMDAGKSPDQIVCSELTQMDTAVVPGTLYFLAGYNRGRSDSLNLSGDGAIDDATSSISGDASGTSAGAATGTTLGDTSGSSDTTASAETGTTGSGTDTATGTDTAANTSTETTTGSDTGTMQAGMPARISGFFEIPVESVITICGQTPERQVSDVVEEQNSASGQGSN